MSATDKTHFVAVVKIEKVEVREDRNVDKGQRDRKIGEVTTLTIKASSLDKLKTKVQGHIDLIEED